MASTFDSLLVFSSGSECSVFVEIDGRLVRRNGIVKNEIQHRPGCWCVELPYSPFFVVANHNFFEIFEPMDFGEALVSAFDELA